MNDPVEYLDLDDLIDLAIALLGDPPPIRDVASSDQPQRDPRQPRTGTTPTRT